MSAPFETLNQDLDTNSVGATTTPESSTDSSCATVYIAPNTGTNATHIINVQVSPDGVRWVTIGTMTGTGVKMFSAVATAWRLKVKTAEGVLSTVKASILGV